MSFSNFQVLNLLIFVWWMKWLQVLCVQEVFLYPFLRIEVLVLCETKILAYFLGCYSTVNMQGIMTHTCSSRQTFWELENNKCILFFSTKKINLDKKISHIFLIFGEIICIKLFSFFWSWAPRLSHFWKKLM